VLLQTFARAGRPDVKRALFSIVKSVHQHLRSKPLPDRLAIYFHELEPHQWDSFRVSISHLIEQGYSTVPASNFVQQNSYDRRLFISFDDNYRSWFTSLKLLDELGLKATFYVNTLPFRDTCDQDTISDYFDRIAHTGERTTLTRPELLEIAAAGHEIGCHTHSHPILSQLPRALWDAEIRDSKSLLEDMLQRDVAHFSYPYGMRRYFSDALRRYCVEIGFRTVASAIPGLQHQPTIDVLNIQRSGWRLNQSLAANLADLRVDGRWFESVTGRSAVG